MRGCAAMTARRRFNPLTDGIPISQSLVDTVSKLAVADRQAGRRAVSLGALQGEATADTAADPAVRTGAASPKAQSARVPNAEASPLVRLRCTDIQRYDHNPRRFVNERRVELRQGLLAQGFEGSLLVTQRSPEAPYMLAAGSNTTLELLQELYRDTGDERFLWVNALVQPFESEAKLLAQHLGENLNRGDMRFFEVAMGIQDLLVSLHEERRRSLPDAKPLSTREAAEALKARGLRAEKTSVALWQFTATRLSVLGQTAQHLSSRGVATIVQPSLTRLAELAQRFGLTTPQFWDELVAPSWREDPLGLLQREPFEHQHLCTLAEHALSQRIDEPLASVHRMLEVLRLNPSATLSGLRQPSPNLIAGVLASASAPAPEDSSEAPMLQSQAPLSLPPSLVQPPAVGAAAPITRKPRGGIPDMSGQAALWQAATLPSDAAMQSLHRALLALLADFGLQDYLTVRDQMPLGYYLELPLVQPGAAPMTEPEQLRARSLLWWTVSLWSGQWLPGAIEALEPQCRFVQQFGQDEVDSPFEGSGIEPLMPEAEELVWLRVLPGPLSEKAAGLDEIERRIRGLLRERRDRLEMLQRLRAGLPRASMTMR